MPSIASVLSELRAAAAIGDREAATFLRMYEGWAANEFSSVPEDAVQRVAD